jgi:hypothetical protein
MTRYEKAKFKGRVWAMTKKKAARASKAGEKKTGRRRSASKKQKDAAQVREEIVGMVKSGAVDITAAVIGQAMSGNVVPAKYLFELAGVFPAVNDGKQAAQEEDCLAKTLLDRIDRPVQKPVKKDDDEAEIVTENTPDEVKPDGGDVIA